VTMRMLYVQANEEEQWLPGTPRLWVASELGMKLIVTIPILLALSACASDQPLVTVGSLARTATRRVDRLALRP